MKITESLVRENPGGSQHPLKSCLTSDQILTQPSHRLYKERMTHTNGPGSLDSHCNFYSD